MKSALFIDFDNIYSGLRRLDTLVADRFALQPVQWIRWLVDELELPEHAATEDKRRFLVRRCYLNPQLYQRFRPAFNRAGFEIIDCPVMTSGGKTSTDIHMVLDIVDLLQHDVRYDEFMVFSADADFTPVLRKLRRWDRRTSVLAIGFPSAAYQASADLLIDQDRFIRSALGFGPAEPVETADLPAAVVDAPSGTQDRGAVTAWIRQEVAVAKRPVSCARLAQRLADDFTGLAADWAGMGSFRRYVDSLDLAPLRFDWASGGGVVFDPAFPPSVAIPAANGRPAVADSPLESLLKQIDATTDVPGLTPSEIRFLLDVLATDLGQHPFHLSDTSKRVRDRCREAGHDVSRGDASFVLKGIAFSGYSFESSENDRDSLGAAFVRSVIEICRRDQLGLTSEDEALLHTWYGEP